MVCKGDLIKKERADWPGLLGPISGLRLLRAGCCRMHGLPWQGSCALAVNLNRRHSQKKKTQKMWDPSVDLSDCPILLTRCLEAGLAWLDCVTRWCSWERPPREKADFQHIRASRTPAINLVIKGTRDLIWTLNMIQQVVLITII